MNTPTHLLTAAALLARPERSARNWAILAGALLPDLSIFVLFGWAQLQGIAQADIWNKLYWQEPWQTLGAMSNSIPLWSLLLAAAIMARSALLAGLGAAGLIHIALDFPVHADDAHKHFWPLTDWRFHSPLSYWDTDHHSRPVMLVEFAICLACMAALWHRILGMAGSNRPGRRRLQPGAGSNLLLAHAWLMAAMNVSAAAATSPARVIGRPTTR